MQKLNDDVEYDASALEPTPTMVRSGLVRRVYALLCMQICLTGGVVAVTMTQPAVLQLFLMPQFALPCFVASVAVVCITPCIGHRWPWNIILLFAATL
jgi:FtsH-binding integral membrane protein